MALREQGFRNVKEFGALGDGVATDGPAIQAALDWVEANGGGTVFLPAGDYKVLENAFNEGLYVGDNTTLLGVGENSVIHFTGDAVASSGGILNRNSSGQYNETQQRVGNFNIHLRNFKVVDTQATEFKNILISLSGVEGGSIRDLWIENCGGYSIHVSRTNDDANVGRDSKDILVDNVRITGFMDQGIEISGAQRVKVTNCFVSGPGTTTGFGQGLLAWNGAQDVLFSNITINKDTGGDNVCALGVWGWGGDLAAIGARQTTNITFENIIANVDMAIRYNPTIHTANLLERVDNTVIRGNSRFTSWDGTGLASDIRHANGLRIEDCTFKDFASHLQFTNPGSTTLQNTVANVDIIKCLFEGGGQLTAYGLSDFRFIGNRFYNLEDDTAAVIIQGGRYGVFKENSFHNIGQTIDVPCILLNKLDESSTIETQFIELSFNSASDDRASKHTDDLIVLQNATDFIVERENTTFFADSDSDVLVNTGSGTIIRSDSGIYTPNDSNSVNLDSLVLTDARYYRKGNMVTVYGGFTANPTAAVATSFMISIPPAYNSQIILVDELRGIAASGATTSMVAEIIGNAPNNTAQVRWIATDLTAQDWSYQFTYQVNPF